MSNQIIARYDIADYAQFRAEFDADAEDRGNASLSVLQIWREGENRAWVLYQIADGKRALAYLDGAAQVFNSRAGVTNADVAIVRAALASSPISPATSRAIDFASASACSMVSA